VNNENEVNEELEEEKCLACDLVLEFKQLIDDEVHWENALRHVLHVALEVKDETMAEFVSEAYSEGYEDGLTTGVVNAAKTMNDLVEATDKQIAEFQAEREKLKNPDEVEAEQVEVIEDISDEEFDKIAKLIRENKGLS
jgi:flagellar biosynthesis/type III secretory pathway protein FliH